MLFAFFVFYHLYIRLPVQRYTFLRLILFHLDLSADFIAFTHGKLFAVFFGLATFPKILSELNPASSTLGSNIPEFMLASISSGHIDNINLQVCLIKSVW